ncbi:hypothetical protein [Chondrinema litorale]|uniref:hypothetical protein n=1 Tax=Chondrinema litorale TaxID=2994555 RepID=UPI002542FA7D|nr:hypothetical protein [Chondrinema litorale]UZR96673.1 hypothetical protein OQ292_21240 [Chondrinema litorale]
MSYLIQIQLKEILIIENGTVEKVEGVNGISFSLFYPKSGVPSVETLRTLRLKDREPMSFISRPFTEKLLFKQEIQGDTFLQVKISAIERVSKFEKILNRLFGTALTTVVGAFTGVGAVFTAVATDLTSSIFELTEPQNNITVIAEGEMPITELTPEGDFLVQLSVPDDLTITQTIRGITKEIRLKKGFTNARVVFDLKRLDRKPTQADLIA